MHLLKGGVMKYYANIITGAYLGGYSDDIPAPENSIEVPYPPPSATYKWDGTVWVAPPPEPWEVDEERDRRINAGFVFNQTTFDSTEKSIRKVTSNYATAINKIISGSQSGDLRWADLLVDFRWIAADNSQVEMDARTFIEFAEALFAWERHHVYVARELKSMSPTPMDYADDSYWS